MEESRTKKERKKSINFLSFQLRKLGIVSRISFLHLGKKSKVFPKVSKREKVGELPRISEGRENLIYKYRLFVSLTIGQGEKSGGLKLCPPHTFLFSVTKQNFKTKNEKVNLKMSNRFKRSEKLKVGRFMPPKYHKVPNEEYDVRKSEAINWLIKNPSILEYVWDKFKQSNDVVYDPETKKWQGVDWEDE